MEATIPAVTEDIISGKSFMGMHWGKNVADATYRMCDLSKTRGDDSVFSGCVFEYCDLTGADFSRSILEDCKFVGCSMNGFQSMDAFLEDVAFERCMLVDANFSDAILDRVSMSGLGMGISLSGALGNRFITKHLVLGDCISELNKVGEWFSPDEEEE